MKRYIKSSGELVNYADYDDDLGELVEVSDNGQYLLYKSVGQKTKQKIYTLVNDLNDKQYRWTVEMGIIPIIHTVTVSVAEVNPSSPIDESIIYLRDSLSEAYNFKLLIEKMIKKHKKTDTGEIEYTRVVVILADNPIKGYDDTYYLPKYKMYLKKHTVIINSNTGYVLGKNKLHDTLLHELSGDQFVPITKCAQATFENGLMRDDAVNLEILSEEQLEYINSLF